MLELEPFGLQLMMQGLPQYTQGAEEASRAVEQMGQRAEMAAQQHQQLDFANLAVGASLAGLGAKLMSTVSGFAMVASRSEELDIVLQRVAAQTGKTVSEVDAERDAVMKMGITHQAASQLMLRLVQSNVDLSEASKLARVAQDLAVVGMRDSSETAMDLAYAIGSGNTVILQKYGIMANLTTMQAGMTKAEKEAAKATGVSGRSQMVLNAIMEQGTRVTGSYESAMTTASKQMRSLARYVEETHRALGTGLVPILSLWVDVQTRVYKAILGLPPVLQKLTGLGLGFAGAMAAISGAAILLVPRMGKWLEILGQVPSLLASIPGAFASFLFSPIGIAVAALAALAAAVYLNIGGLRDTFVSFTQDLGKVVSSLAAPMQKVGTTFLDAIREGLSKPIGAEALDLPRRRLSDLSVALRTTRDVTVQETGRMAEVTAANAKRMAEAGKDASVKLFGFSFDPYRFAEGAAQLMAAFASGLLDGLNKYVIPTITGVVNAVAAFLVGASPPPEGPLSEIITGGAEIIRSWLSGMSKVSLKEIEKIAGKVQQALEIPMFQAEEALRGLEKQGSALDKALRPLQENLRRAQAAATIAIAPLREQKNAVDATVAALQAQVDKENEAAKAAQEVFGIQLAMMDELLRMDQVRIDDLDRQIAIAEKQAKTEGDAGRKRVEALKRQKLELLSATRVQEDQRDALRAQLEAEKDQTKITKSAAQVALESAQGQQTAIEKQMQVQQDQVNLVQQALSLAEAQQTEQRIALENEIKLWQERRDELSYYASLASKALGQIKRDLAEAAAQAAGAAAAVPGAVPKIPPITVDPKLLKLGERLGEIFAPVSEKLGLLRENLGKLQTAFEGLGKGVLKRLGPLGDLLERIFKNIDWGKVAYGLGLVAAALLAIGAAYAVVTLVGAALGLIATPIGAIVLGLAALGLAWETNFLGIQDLARSLGLLPKKNPLEGWTTEQVTAPEPSLWEKLLEIFQDFSATIDWKAINKFLSDVGKGIEDIGGKAVKWITETAIPGFSDMISQIDWKAIGQFLDDTKGKVEALGQAVITWIGDKLGTIQEFAKSLGLLPTKNPMEGFTTGAITAPPDPTPYEKLVKSLGSLRQGFLDLVTVTPTETFWSSAQPPDVGPWERFKVALGPVRNLIARFGEVFKGLPASFAKLGPNVTGLGQSLGNLGKALSPLLPVFGFLAKIVGGVLYVAFELVAAIIQRLPATLGAVIDIASGIINLISGMIEGFILLITGQLTTEKAREILGGFVTSLGEVFGGLLTIVDQVWGGIWDTIVNTINDLTGTSLKSWDEMKAGIVTKIDEILDSVKTWGAKLWASVTGWVSTAVDDVVQFFKDLWKKLVGGSIIPDLVNDIVAWFLKLKDRAVAKVDELWTKLMSWFTLIRDNLITKANELYTGILGWFTSLRADADAKVTELKAALLTLWDNIKSYAVTKAWEIWSGVVGYFESLRADVETKVEAAKTAVGTAFDNIKTDVETKGAAIVTAAKAAFEGVKTGIADKCDEILTAIGSWLTGTKDSIVAELTDASPGAALDKLLGAGKTIIDSLWTGMKTKWAEVVEWAKGVALAIVSAIKRQFRIVGDPYSVVFQNIGKSIFKGLQMGLEQMQPKVIQEITAIAQPMRTEMTRAGSQSTVNNYQVTRQGPTFNVTANYARVQSVGSLRDDLRLLLALA